MAPIGVFDSGYGGLTILKELVKELPEYDYLYLGDNARAPYGGRSFETVYEYTLECVKWLFDQGCPLVILACNTASAKALRTIQQKDLPVLAPNNRVLGVIRPTAEMIGNTTKTGHVGVLGTQGTILSGSYEIEIGRFFPETSVHLQACPMWVPLIENGEHNKSGADYFVKQDLNQLLEKDVKIDSILLACTHYPLLLEKIRKYIPEGTRIITQGSVVAASLADYLKRHSEMELRLSKNRQRHFFTSDSAMEFERQANLFFGGEIRVQHANIG
jgi:glutamate racemase